MGPPRHLGQGDSGSGRGPFGEKAFRAALAGCVVLVALGVLMMIVAGGATRSVGTSFVVLGGFGLLTGGAGLLAERLLGRRPPPPPEVRRSNGHRR
jgi:protein-S-isoprenylcysteine O-methyltransferase Ste14